MYMQLTLTHLFLSMEAQLQKLGIRCQQFLNKERRQLCVDPVYNLKVNPVNSDIDKMLQKNHPTDQKSSTFTFPVWSVKLENL